ASAGVVSLEVEDRPQEEIFAEARLLPPEERPQPPPPRRRPRRVRRTKAPTPPESRAELSQNLRNRLRRARTNAPSTGDATQDLVNRLTTPNAGTGQTLQDVTTNIQAVAGGPGASNLSVTGVQSAIAGVSGVNTARASGSANVGPLGGTDAAGTVMGLEMRSTMGPVRGRVRAVSALGRQTGGSLSRAEVQRVINGKVGRIQRCYERALLSNASLAGRIAFSWTIRPNGRVGGVRQASSTLGNAGVSNCVAGVIRSMRFPRPQGGAVQITYPFMFSR
ncbi:MAG: AgmX/PglI C-terminal domain-containing protein, partial [Myxococcota bacterium]